MQGDVPGFCQPIQFYTGVISFHYWMIGLVGYYDGCLHHRTPIYLNWQEAWNLNISAVLSIHLIFGINYWSF